MIVRVSRSIRTLARRTAVETVVALAALAAAGCATAARRPPSEGAAPRVDAGQLLRDGDAQMRRGCYDCLRDALSSFEMLTDDPVVGPAARERAVRTALLLALRETELGLRQSGYIARAQDLLGPPEAASPELAALLDIAGVIASGPVGFTRSATTDSQLTSSLRVSRSQAQWASVLRNLMPDDLTASYLWLTLACGSYGYNFPDNDQRETLLAPLADVPLIAYKSATACGLTAAEPLDALRELDPRFGEIDYHLGLLALGGQTRRLPDLDAADLRFRAAYEWRQDWPTLTLAIANVAMSAEDFARADEFYNRTLELSPDDPDALLGLTRALTYENRNDDAIAAADRLLALGRNPGEARYWRAMNLARLKRDAEAWVEIEEAAHTLANADVPKLAGMLAINRRDFALARQRLELALSRRRTDCETAYYLQTVLAEQRDWEGTARVAADAGSCFETEQANLRQEIATIQAAVMAPDRQARLIDRRGQQLASAGRMGAAAWFNAAAASFNLSRGDEARRYAEKVADDAFFGERARSLLDRLK